MNTAYKRDWYPVCRTPPIGAAGSRWSLAQDGSDSNEKVIQTSASGEVMVAPTGPRVTVSVRTENADVKVAQANARIADAMIRAIHDAGIADEDTKTVRYSIYPVYDSSGPFGTKIRTYQVTSSIQVTLRDVTRTGEIIDIAVADGANQVDSINFCLSEEKEASLRADVIKETFARTKLDADAVASAIGMTIPVKNVTVGQSLLSVLYESARYAGATDSKVMSAPADQARGTESVSPGIRDIPDQ